MTEAEAAAAAAGSPHAGTGVIFIPQDTDDTSAPKLLTRETQQVKHTLDLLEGANQGKVIVASNPANLNVGAFAMYYRLGSTDYFYAGDVSFACTASQTNYLYLDASATLKKSTSDWPGGDHIKLAIAVANASAVTSVTDVRWRNLQAGAINNWWTFPAQLPVDMNSQDLLNIKALHLIGFNVVIAAGIITLPAFEGHVVVDTEGAAGADNLDTIDTTFINSSYTGRLILLRGLTAARVVTVTGTGNIKLLNGAYALDSVQKTLLVMYLHNTGFIEIARGYHTISTLVADLNCASKKLSTIGRISFSDPTEATLDVNGQITITSARTRVSNFAGAAEDNLDFIAGGSVGDVITISAAIAGTATTLRSVQGNLRLKNDGTCRLANYYDSITLQQDTAFQWLEICRSNSSLKDIPDPDKSIPYERAIFTTGTLPLNVNKEKIYIKNDIIIERIFAAVNTAPAGGTAIIDLLDDGASIFVNEGEMAIIADGTTTAFSAVKNAAVAAGSVLNTAQRGVSVNGAVGLTVTIIGKVARLS